MHVHYNNTHHILQYYKLYTKYLCMYKNINSFLSNLMWLAKVRKVTRYGFTIVYYNAVSVLYITTVTIFQWYSAVGPHVRNVVTSHIR